MSKIAAKITSLSPDTPFTNDIERAQTLYFNWLCNMVHVDDYCGESWYILAKILHNIEFYWTIPNDENRAVHGVKLRQVWIESMEDQAEDLGVGHPMFPLDSLTGPCSVLEMMVGLAVSIESEIMMSSEKGNRTAVWFWEMIINFLYENHKDEIPLRNPFEIPLFHLWSDRFIDEQRGEMLRMSVSKIMDRTYDKYGNGGLFPLIDTDEDQREVEIWYQAQHWLEENYPEEFY